MTDITTLRAENERLTAERDRQYDQNTEQITRIAALEAENEKLRTALKGCAGFLDHVGWPMQADRARAALEEKQ